MRQLRHRQQQSILLASIHTDQGGIIQRIRIIRYTSHGVQNVLMAMHCIYKQQFQNSNNTACLVHIHTIPFEDCSKVLKPVNLIFLQELAARMSAHVDVFHGNETMMAMIHKFAHADVVLAYHGAGMSNVLFCKEEALVVEVTTFSSAHNIGPMLQTNKVVDGSGSEDGLLRPPAHVWRSNYRCLFACCNVNCGFWVVYQPCL